MLDHQYKQQDGSVVQPETFRDSIGTMDQSGKRKWVYPKRPSGKYTTYRTYVSWLLLIILYITPFIKINKNPLFLFNIIKGEFYFFSFPFYTQDFYLLALGMVTSLVFIILFTVIYGRLFCGWICPQTIFMEMVFRKIEYIIEGDRNKQIRLDKQPWDSEKIYKKSLKWSIFIVISFIISNLFLSYIIGLDKLKQLIIEGPIEHLDTFLGLLFFTGLFYFVFAWFREQACTLVCPYGRLQGVLIDKNTVAVTYDYKRGESIAGRSTWKKNEDRKAIGKGDCIDCGQCVVVCPTGIDIRNGTQLECVNCTACIDACDEVMEKVGLPKGLIRYASDNNIEKGTKFRMTSRVYAYTGVLVLLVFILASLLLFRSSVEVKVMRKEGSKYIEFNDSIVNPYQYTLINKTNDTLHLVIKLVKPQTGKIQIKDNSNTIMIPAHQNIKGKLEIYIPSKNLKTSKEEIIVGAYDKKGILIDDFTTTFAGPYKMSY